MKRAVKVASDVGCFVAVLAPLLAILFYPRANWLFGFVLVGIAILALSGLFEKDNPAPQALADEIERFLTGNCGGWDVDDFEHHHIRDPQLRELWSRSMKVGGLPEEWVGLDEERKNQMRKVIRDLRELAEGRNAGQSMH
jgi:hypothetical protein